MRVVGVFVTAFYSFRMYFLVFHGRSACRARRAMRRSTHDLRTPSTACHVHDDPPRHHGLPPHESPAVVWVPLVALAIPSLIIGFLTVGPMLVGDFFGGAIFIDAEHPVLQRPAELRTGEWYCTPS